MEAEEKFRGFAAIDMAACCFFLFGLFGGGPPALCQSLESSSAVEEGPKAHVVEACGSWEYPLFNNRRILECTECVTTTYNSEGFITQNKSTFSQCKVRRKKKKQ